MRYQVPEYDNESVFDFAPKNSSNLLECAAEAAEEWCMNEGGMEAEWPVIVRLIACDGTDLGDYSVELQWRAMFSARPCLDYQQ